LTKYPKLWKKLYEYYLEHSETFAFSPNAISRTIPENSTETLMDHLVQDITSGKVACNTVPLQKWISDFTETNRRSLWITQELPELAAAYEKKLIDPETLKISEEKFEKMKYKDNPDMFPLSSAIQFLAISIDWGNIPLDNVKQILTPWIRHPDNPKYTKEYFMNQVQKWKNIKIINEATTPQVFLL